MSRELSQLQLRREWLVAQADVQRHELALIVHQLHTPISVVNYGVGIVRAFLRYRLLIAGFGLILIRWNRRKVSKMPRGLWSAFLLTVPRYAWLIKQVAGLATRKPVPKNRVRRA
ncbi:MAG: hypothetical protein H7X91_11345 [Burkholderiales bacterium]|nr:hypothetical protein [Burkholderiales bacterium]